MRCLGTLPRGAVTHQVGLGWYVSSTDVQAYLLKVIVRVRVRESNQEYVAGCLCIPSSTSGFSPKAQGVKFGLCKLRETRLIYDISFSPCEFVTWYDILYGDILISVKFPLMQRFLFEFSFLRPQREEYATYSNC